MDIRQLTPDDLPSIRRLIALAGWNQTDQDIERLLALEPAGCFAACEGGQVVGTTTTTIYGTDLAWVGMVLVDRQYRRRGIATALMERALDHLRACGVRTIKLDATPAGRPVYERLGFEPESVVERWAGTPPADRLEEVSPGGWEQIAGIDLAVFSVDRSALMQAIIRDSDPPLVARGPRGGIDGYAFARPGRQAAYIGPVVADDLGAARALLRTVAAGLGPVVIDIDPSYPGAVGLLRDFGFVRQRELLRMRLGPAIFLQQAPPVFAIAGPEVG